MKNVIRKSETDKKLKEEEINSEEKRLQAHYQALEKVRDKKEWYENYAAKLGKPN